MPQPASTPRWNTDGSNRVDPPSGQKDTGWVVTQSPPSSYFNWWQNLVYQWILYLQGLTSEALTWLALQTFNLGIAASTTTTNGNAIVGTGNGTGAGVRGVSGASSTGKGVHGVGNAAFASGVLGENTHPSGGTGVKGVSSAGIGVEGSSGSGPAGSFVNSHNVANDWPTLYAYNDSIGDVANFTAEGGVALRVFGGESNHGAEFRGNSAGLAALKAWATAASQPGGIFEGATGVSPAGPGATFKGGSPAIGAGAPGLRATGGTQAPGAVVNGGLLNAIGLQAYGGTTGGPAVEANGFSNTDVAIDCKGTIELGYSGLIPYNAFSLNRVHRKNIAKAWVRVRFNNTATPVIIDGCNVASVSHNTANARTTINFAGSLGADYGFIAQPEQLPGKSAIEFSTLRGTSSITLDHYTPSTSSIGAFTPDTSVSLNNTTWLFMFWGQ